MPFALYYLSSYERCIKRLGDKERHIAGLVVSALYNYFNSGSSAMSDPYMIQLNKRTYRLVFKKLQGAIWEAYLDNQVRVLTRLEKNKYFLVFAGNHDQVKKFLKEA